MFLSYLSDHPFLANHELVWEFILMPELQNLEHEETYFMFLNEEVVKLDKAVHDVWVCSRKLIRSAQDVPQELHLLSSMLDRADQINFDNKHEFVQALKSIAAIQTTMYTSDFESLENMFK
ncbi:hypothetical protein EC957_000299, partial [Mortierella hygrophila]